MRVLINYCIREIDRIGVRGRRKPCAARLNEEGRHAVSKINRTISMKIMIEDGKRFNILAVRERLKTVRGVDKTKSF